MNRSERDQHLTELAKVRRIIERHLIAPGPITKRHERRRRRRILEPPIRRIGRPDRFKVKIRRRRVIRQLKRPRRAHRNRRIATGVGRNRPRRRELVASRPRGPRQDQRKQNRYQISPDDRHRKPPSQPRQDSPARHAHVNARFDRSGDRQFWISGFLEPVAQLDSMFQKSRSLSLPCLGEPGKAGGFAHGEFQKSRIRPSCRGPINLSPNSRSAAFAVRGRNSSSDPRRHRFRDT